MKLIKAVGEPIGFPSGEKVPASAASHCLEQGTLIKINYVGYQTYMLLKLPNGRSVNELVPVLLPEPLGGKSKRQYAP